MSLSPVVAKKVWTKLYHSPLAPLFTIIAVIGIFLLAQVIAVILMSIYALITGNTGNPINGLMDQFALHLIVSLTGIGLVYIVMRVITARWSTIGLKRPRPIDAFYALIGFGWYLLIYFTAAFLIRNFVPAVDLEQVQDIGFSTETSGVALLFIFASLVILPPLYEEILTRGLLLKGLRGWLSLPVAALITSILFAIPHLQLGSGEPLLWVAGIDTFILSLVLVYLREKTGSLWPAIGLHAIKNCVAFTFLFILKIAV